ncbi:putative aminophospholipid-translocase [Marasmius sp. AFHP31]|nr:putative aminophospholipid-translocase [Marasmius sp. AFHP31]
MAREGLRTLVDARKRLSPMAYGTFKGAYHRASVSLESRNKAMASVVEGVFGKEMAVLGLTVGEDKLQEDAKGTLELLKNAGVKIWMLTVDKAETARCIVIATKLVARGQYIREVLKMKTEE